MCIVITAGVSYFDFTLIGVYLCIASVYLRIRECIFTHSRVYIYATSVFIHHRRKFTPFWCKY